MSYGITGNTNEITGNTVDSQGKTDGIARERKRTRKGTPIES